MSKWFSWTLKFKQLVTLKHALEDKIKKRKEEIIIEKSKNSKSDLLDQLEKDLNEEELLYKELSEWLEDLRRKFSK